MPTTKMTSTQTVRAMFAAYLARDYETAEQLLADDFTFTSPQDDHIDRAAFLRTCFPTADRLVSQDLLEVVETGNGGVFVMYEYVLLTGERHRNTELIALRDGRLVETQVFFGGSV